MAFGTLKRLLSACCLACKQRSAKDAWRLLRFRLSGGNMITMRRKQNARWAYISYIPEAIVRNDPEFLNFHQNTREMKVIADCFLNHGFNIVVQHYQSKIVPPPHEYDIIFGLEPNFVLCAPMQKPCIMLPEPMSATPTGPLFSAHHSSTADMAQTYRPADWLWMTAVQGRVTVSCKSARQIL